MATIRVLSVGTKFIPKWRDANLKFTFKKFEDFKRRLQNKMYFSEIAPDTFCFEKQALKKLIMKKTKSIKIKILGQQIWINPT